MRYIVYYVGFGLLVIAVLVGCWFLADWIIPQSEIDKIEAIGKWAKEELERREAKRSEDGHPNAERCWQSVESI